MSSVQSWGSDAPSTGAYQVNQVGEVLKPAGFASLLFGLADKRKVLMGNSLTVPAFQNLDFPTSTALDEDAPIPMSKLSITAKTITMSERGRAVAITGKTERRSPFDVLQAHRDAVAQMMTRELEEVIATALKTMPIKYNCLTSSTYGLATNGTAAGAAVSQPNVFHMQTIGMLLADSYRVPVDPRYNAYVAVLRGNGVLGIQRDSEFRTYFTANGLTPIETARVGQIGDCVIYKHNDTRVLSNAIGTGSAYSEGVVFGKEGVLFGFLEQIGLKYDFSEGAATNFGRFKYIAWMGDYGAGLHSDSANADLVRGLHISST